MADPTAAANLAELQADYNAKKAVYDNLVDNALANNDASKVNDIMAAKQAMSEALSNVLDLTIKAGEATDDQQNELIRRIMEIQRDYNGLLVATDKLQTLRMIHQTMDLQNGVGLKIFGVLFTVASLALLGVAVSTR
jgi:hypothetical protein